MPYLYAVRCNFRRPDLEPAWNDWYGGEKIAQLLAKPMFRAVQRFRLSDGSGRGYLALWQVDGPEAFATPEYKADWGFAEWRAHIADWSRDLFDAAGTPGTAFAGPMEGALQVIAFDGMAADAAEAARGALAERARTMWFPAAGLDRHTPLIGLRQFADLAAAQASLAQSMPAGVQAGVYRPISAFVTAALPARA
jgi:hypothetical protein